MHIQNMFENFYAKHRGLVIWDLKIGSEMEIKQQLQQHISINQ